jgi:hypothetical protein
MSTNSLSAAGSATRSAMAFVAASSGTTAKNDNNNSNNHHHNNDDDDSSSESNKKTLHLHTSSSNSDNTPQQPQEEPPTIPQLLPSSDENKNIPRIQLGETISFEDMGPIIINVDGTTRRIDNWNELSEQEQKVTWRRISKRNEERRAQLLKLQQEEGDEEQQEGTAKDCGDDAEL